MPRSEVPKTKELNLLERALWYGAMFDWRWSAIAHVLLDDWLPARAGRRSRDERPAEEPDDT